MAKIKDVYFVYEQQYIILHEAGYEITPYLTYHGIKFLMKKFSELKFVPIEETKRLRKL